MGAQATATATRKSRRKKGSTSKRDSKRSPEKGAAAAPRRRAEDRYQDALRREVFGIGVLAVSLALLLALATFDLDDVSASGMAAQTGRAQNLIGPVGAHAADLLLGLFGIAAFLLPVTLAIPGALFLAGRRVAVRVVDVVGYPVLIACGAALAHLLLRESPVLGHDAGGELGATIGEVMVALVGMTGAYIFLYALLALTFVLTTRVSLVKTAGHAVRPLTFPARVLSRGTGHMAELIVQKGSDGVGGWWIAQKDGWTARKEARADAARAGVEEAEVEAEVEEADSDGASKPKRSWGLAMKAPGSWSAKGKKRPSRADAEALREAAHSAPFTLGRVEPPHDGPEPAMDESVVDLEDSGAELDDPLDRAALAGRTDTMYAEAVSDETPRPAAAARADDAEPHARTALPPKPVVKRRKAEEYVEQLEIPLARESSGAEYIPPPLSLLNIEDKQVADVDSRFLEDQAERLVDALNTFGIEGVVTEIHPGPVVTMFEFEPAPGVRVKKIAGLADDLAMALKALKVRIVAPIPGKGVVGFEVPNETREMVYLKEILGHAAFRSKKHNLPISLGKDIHGTPVVTDLSRMPHLLVAGTTGSGKSVGVNGMITSLLYHAGPDDVRFIMIDPKMLELSIYEGIPHLLLPVVTDPRKASLALKWAVDEMERRYELMKDAGVRDIRGYNRKMAKLRPEAAVIDAEEIDDLAHDVLDAVEGVESETVEGQAPDVVIPSMGGVPPDAPLKLPYVVVVIDEFADLLMVAGKEVEISVARLAQKARAAGIHVILATQRPSTDVITGVIKANFPTRIAFQVSSGTDSKVILDGPGAEHLLGKGDMLFRGGHGTQRVHGAFVSEEEISQVVEFIADQLEPDYLDESVLAAADEDGGGDLDDDAELDEAYEAAVRLVLQDKRASTSHLQRRLSLGYNRAARIMDQMERDGLIGPGSGAKPREIDFVAMQAIIGRWDGMDAV
jgi:S-DNA-T family DNA segregation ATPase FtsK/SpoIIIE